METQGTLLQRRPRLAWLPRRERRALSQLAVTMDVPAGQSLVRQGTPADAFYVIEHGRASVIRDDEHLQHLGGGDFFGELGLLQGGVRTASVVAGSDIRVRVISKSDFGQAMRVLPTLANAVRARALERLRTLPA